MNCDEALVLKIAMAVQRHENTRVRQKQIIEAARKLIIRYGSEHVTVRRIAREVGLTEGAIYRHFRSKRDILSLLADYIEDSLLDDITKSGDKPLTPLEVLERSLNNHLSAVEQRRGVSFQVIAEIISFGDKKLNRKVSDTIDRYIRHLRGLLEAAVEAGEVRKNADLDAAATLLFSMIQGLVNIWALSDYRFDPQKRFAPMWETFRKAISAR